MFSVTRRTLANPLTRVVEYYRHREWEQHLQKTQMKGPNYFYKNIPWGLMGATVFGTIMFGMDLGVGLSNAAGAHGSDVRDTTLKDMERKKALVEEQLKKRATSLDAMREHREGTGILSRQGHGEV